MNFKRYMEIMKTKTENLNTTKYNTWNKNAQDLCNSS